MAKPADSGYKSQKRQIDTDCRTDTFRPCYLLYGPEEYLIRDCLKTLRAALLNEGDEMNLLAKRNEDIDIEEIDAFAQTMPFFAKRRVVLLEDAGRFQKQDKALAAYLKSPAEGAVFVLVAYGFPAQDKKMLRDFADSTLVKTCAKTGRVLECGIQTPETIKLWVVNRLGRTEGKVFQEKTIDLFLSRMGSNMGHIAQEMEKLICYTDGRKEITAKDVDKICAPWLDGRIYDLTDALAKRDRAGAMEHYMTLLEMEETHTRILYHILRQLRSILMVKEMVRAHLGREAMVRALELTRNREWVVGRYQDWSRLFTERELRMLVDLILTNDMLVKRSMLDESIAVEMVIARCTAKEKQSA